MKRESIVTVICLGLMLFGSFFVREAKAATRTVDNTSDNGSLTACTAVANDCSLRGAIAASAILGDTINFDSSVFGTPQTIGVTNFLFIDKSIIISGPGANLLTITAVGSANFEVIRAWNGIIQISNLKVTNGGSSGIFNRADTTLSNVVVTGNHNFSGGGGIRNGTPFSRLELYDCTVSNNTSNVDGGGIYSIEESSFGLNAVLIINRSTISGNTAGGNGGGIYGGGSVTIYNSTISGNRSTGNSGGGVFAVGHPSVGGGNISYSTISGNQANASGGGVFSLNSRPLTLSNNIIAGNSNSANSSPDVYDIINSQGYNLIGNSTGSTNWGGTDLLNVNPQLNPLASNGGSTQTHSVQCGSPAINAANPSSFPSIDQRGIGRPIYARADIGSVETNCQLVTNNNNGGAGSLRQAIADAAPGAVITFLPSFFNQPRTISLGGAVLDIFKDLTISGTGSTNIIIDGENLSRIFNIDGPTLNLSNVRLTRGFPGTNINGGAILVNGNATLNASNITIDNSHASWGAGIYVVGTLNLDNSTITNCTADARGGAIWNDPQSTTNVTFATVSNNHADDRGGGIGNSGSMTIRSSTISGNTATRPTGSGSTPIGGGIYTDGYLAFYDSTLVNNSAQYGGGLFNKRFVLDGYSDIRNSTIANNSAVQTGNGADANGGGIYADSDYIGGSTATVDAKNVTLYGNSAANAGGGIYMQQFTNNNPVFNLENSIVAANTASAAPDMSGRITSYGYNLITTTSGSTWSPSSPTLAGNIINPTGGVRLAPLGNYGGLTQTMPPLPNSPAIDAGNPNNLFGNDQRGSQRPIGGRGDIGAFERNIVFNQSSLPFGKVNRTYNQTLTVTRLTSFAEPTDNQQSSVINFAPFTYSIVTISGQQFPPGLTLNSNGQITGTPTASGTYTFTIKATDTADGSSGIQQYTIEILSPTAANTSVSGRVLTSDGRGLVNAKITLTDSSGNSWTAITSSFGYYRFEGVEVGQTYVLSVTSKRFEFMPQIVIVTGEMTDLILIAQP